MTTKIIWRLKEQPTSEQLRELVKDGILTKDEARQVLFNSVEENSEGHTSGRTKESLEEEIKFLRQLVEKLSNNNTYEIVKYVQQIEPVWRTRPWYASYGTWCDTSKNTVNLSTSTFSAINTNTL